MRVLVVDDEQFSRRTVAHALRQGGYDVTTVAGGREALKELRLGEYQLVVSDWKMPDMDGIELCRTIRAGDPAHYIYFIMLSSNDNSQDVIEGLAAGADDYLSKPFNPAELILRANIANRILKAAEAEMANAVKSEFLANMSHEIRTPMTAILGFADILMERAMDGKQRDALATIQRNGRHLVKILDDILDLSRIEAGKMKSERIPFSPCPILSDVVSLMRIPADAKNLLLKLEYDGPIPATIQSDPTRLRQILVNLTGNAIKFTETGTIRLVVRLLGHESAEPKLQLDVVDSGIGISEHQMADLFKPFSQADTSATRKYGGTGLGLTISKRLAEMLGGDITVTSALGEGSTFTVTLETGPLDNVGLLDDPAEPDVTSGRDSAARTQKSRLNCHVLLAEDGPDNQRLIAFVLKKAGALVTVAENGKIAYDLATESENDVAVFDLILMDMQMPVMDGYDATTKLREAGYAGPIVALTAHAMSTDREKCLNAGCTDYITKPVDREKLIRLVAKYTSQVNQPPRFSTNRG